MVDCTLCQFGLRTLRRTGKPYLVTSPYIYHLYLKSNILYRSLLITVSYDHTARIWDYTTNRCELYHSFRNDEPVTVAIHPTGFQTIVGFRDRFRLYNIMLDQLALHSEVMCKKCLDVKFSNGGHLFAVASNTNILVYDYITLQICATLVGHVMPVRAMCWVSLT